MFSGKYYEVSEKTYFGEHLRSDFRKWLFKIFFLNSRFQNHPDKNIPAAFKLEL